MKSLCKAVAMAFAMLLVGGCATSPATVPADVAVRLRKIGVISLTGQVFTRQYTGFTVFGNEQEEKDISSWQVDDRYQEQLAAALQAQGREAVTAPYSLPDFRRVYDLNGPWDAPAFRGPNWGAIAGATRAHCTSHQLDAVLLVIRSQVGDPGKNQSFGGAGIYMRAGGGGNQLAILHLVSQVALLDCATAKPIIVRPLVRSSRDTSPGLPPPPSPFLLVMAAAERAIAPGRGLSSLPARQLPAELAKQPLGQWTEEVQRKMQADLIALPGEAWGEVLQGMFTTRK